MNLKKRAKKVAIYTVAGGSTLVVFGVGVTGVVLMAREALEEYQKVRAEQRARNRRSRQHAA